MSSTGLHGSDGPGGDDPATGELVCFCADEAATKAFAGRLALLLRPGDVLLLDGDLGAGKTTFTQGLAAAVGVDSGVTSPTFTLMNIYATTAGFDLVHVDVYRLERLSEVVDLALPEMIEDGAVVVVEWGGRAASALPGPHLQISIERGSPGADVAGADVAGAGAAPGVPDPESSRTIRLRPDGEPWHARRAQLESIPGVRS